MASGSRRHPAFQSCLGLRPVSMRHGCSVQRSTLVAHLCMDDNDVADAGCCAGLPDPQQSAIMKMCLASELASELASVECITFLLSSDRLTD